MRWRCCCAGCSAGRGARPRSRVSRAWRRSSSPWWRSTSSSPTSTAFSDMDVKPEPSLLLVGTDFRCAPIELRELVSCTGEQAEHALVHLLARPGVTEAFLLSTCNRTEIYLQPQDEDEAYRTSLDVIFLQKAPELEKPGRLYVKRNGEAA